MKTVIGQIIYLELFRCNLTAGEGQRIFNENRLHERCQSFVEDATRLV